MLIAAQSSAWAVLKAMLGDVADLFPAHTTADAFKILKRERIDLIICTIAFDESRMMEFLATVKRTISVGHIPFLCARVLPSIVRDSLVPTIRDGCKALGAADLVDIARLPPSGSRGFSSIRPLFSRGDWTIVGDPDGANFALVSKSCNRAANGTRRRCI